MEDCGWDIFIFCWDLFEFFENWMFDIFILVMIFVVGFGMCMGDLICVIFKFLIKVNGKVFIDCILDLVDSILFKNIVVNVYYLVD